MKKIIKFFSNLWKYGVMRETHIETEVEVGKAVNKLGNTYYYRDTYSYNYKGYKLMYRERNSRIFIKKSEYEAAINA